MKKVGLIILAFLLIAGFAVRSCNCSGKASASASEIEISELSADIMPLAETVIPDGYRLLKATDIGKTFGVDFASDIYIASLDHMTFFGLKDVLGGAYSNIKFIQFENSKSLTLYYWATTEYDFGLFEGYNYPVEYIIYDNHYNYPAINNSGKFHDFSGKKITAIDSRIADFPYIYVKSFSADVIEMQVDTNYYGIFNYFLASHFVIDGLQGGVFNLGGKLEIYSSLPVRCMIYIRNATTGRYASWFSTVNCNFKLYVDSPGVLSLDYSNHVGSGGHYSFGNVSSGANYWDNEYYLQVLVLPLLENYSEISTFKYSISPLFTSQINRPFIIKSSMTLSFGGGSGGGDMQQLLDEAFENGRQSGYNQGHTEGYLKGQKENIEFGGLVSVAFNFLDKLLSIQIFGMITIGSLFYIGFALCIVFLVLRYI